MRVVIAGAGGGVGASLAFNLLLSELEGEVVMVDARQNMVHSHLWDLEQVLEQTGPSPAHRVRSGSVDDIAAADVLVITAAAPLTVNHSRMVYLRDNAAIVAPLLDRPPAGVAGHGDPGHQPGGSARHVGAAAHGPGAHAAAGLHAQRLPAPAHGHRARPGRGTGARAGVDGRRARRSGRAAVGPRGPGRRARRAGRGAAGHGDGVRAAAGTCATWPWTLRARRPGPPGWGSRGWSGHAWIPAETSCGRPRSCSAGSTGATTSASASR